jgi:hypothetical protein
MTSKYEEGYKSGVAKIYGNPYNNPENKCSDDAIEYSKGFWDGYHVFNEPDNINKISTDLESILNRLKRIKL